MTIDSVSSSTKESGSISKERAKARWSILRSALLQHAQVASAEHSIHRFPGYQLLRRSEDTSTSRLAPKLNIFEWDFSQSHEENQNRLRIACLALAAVSPKGKCLQVLGSPKHDQAAWIESLKAFCRPSVAVLIVEVKESCAVTLLVQETSSSTKYKAYEYVLDKSCSLWTREHRRTKLSLEDLVSHRTTGVDNTGNVCVWDSELSLAYFLYHHTNDFGFFQTLDSAPRRMLELGTGMAGLAAVALGLRLAQQQGTSMSKIHINLTDGHPDGVLNNRVNQGLTSSDQTNHPYNLLEVSAQVLLWTNDLESALLSPQDLVLASDCVHFQNFHSALAITALRSLRVGGIAIFCQPTRADSLDNFSALLSPSTVIGLITKEWWTHSILDEQQEKAKTEYGGLYDPNLHHPKILIVRKIRDLTADDCKAFVEAQESR